MGLVAFWLYGISMGLVAAHTDCMIISGIALYIYVYDKCSI